MQSLNSAAASGAASPSFVAKAFAAALPLLAASLAQAQVHVEKPTYPFEKCYAVAKAGANDCFTAANACGSTSTTDNQRDTWIYVPKGVCKKLVGGKLDAPKP